MLFLDLNKLKIIKDYHYQTQAGVLLLNIEAPLMAQSAKVIEFMQKIIVPCGVPVLYDITINASEGIATEDEADSFISVTNFLISIFFSNMIKPDGRRREHRFDVPQKLLAAKVNRSTLKKAVNQQTINDTFNIIFRYKDLIYILCDEKDIPWGESTNA